MQTKLPLIGKTLYEVADILGTDYSYRVTTRDGVSYVATQDFRADRVNLTLVEGKVTDYSIG